MRLSISILNVALVLVQLITVNSFSLTTTPLSTLLSDNADTISELKQIASEYPDAPSDDIFYLRYSLSSPEKSKNEIIDQLKSTLEWRSNEGKDICSSVASAVASAMAQEGSWNNDPVRDAAPHSAIINEYITPSQCLTTTNNSGDLCYIIRAGMIDDVELMSKVSLEEMTDFFLYTKEVNAIVANRRSVEQGRLVRVLAVNDLAGVKMIGGDAKFRQALGAASNKANDIYPNLNGPTFLLNLPKLLNSFTKLFTPMFPGEVRKRLKFERGPLENVDELVEISHSGDQAKRKLFLSQIDEMLAE